MLIGEGAGFHEDKQARPFVGASGRFLEELLGSMVEKIYRELTSRKEAFERDDTYWNGKEFGKISEVIHIADQLGKIDVRDHLVRLLQRRIEDWADANGNLFFYYDKTWSALVGYPDSYGSADQLNDAGVYIASLQSAAKLALQPPRNPDHY